MPSIIESMTGVSVRSPYFSDNPTLDLFLDKTGKTPIHTRVALLYGANGSGKSTLAQGFREYADSTIPRTVELEPRGKSGILRLSPGGRPEKIFVFDEKYIDQSVKLQDAGLDTIVLFDKQIKLEAQISDIDARIGALNEDGKRMQTEYQAFQDAENDTAPVYWFNAIRQRLREKGGWAETKGIRINRNRTSAKVTDAEIDQIGRLRPQQSQAATQAAFDQLFNTFSRIDASAKAIPTPVKAIPYDPALGKITAAMLREVPQRQDLTSREAELLRYFDLNVISSAKGFLVDRSQMFCPHCLQPVSDDYRERALDHIERILNPEVETFKRKLESLFLREIFPDSYLACSSLDRQVYRDTVRQIAAFNAEVARHNSAIQAKIADPFQTLEYDPAVISGAFMELNQQLWDLEQARQGYNSIISDRKKAQARLHELNDELAYYAIRDQFDNYCRCREAQDAVKQKLSALNFDIQQLAQKRNELDAQHRNFKVAADQINQSLEYIFCAKGRLELELGDDRLYHLKSRGQRVTPEKISCGERNALALCYFFTQIGNNMDADNPYGSECLLVIDDPVSSFDFENKIGILSFLRLKFAQVLSACATTKLLVSTHDLSVLLDLSDAVADVTKNKSIKAALSHVQLQNRQLVPLFKKRHNEYTQLLERVYAYAKTHDPDQDIIIGNMMRRAMEAFSSFSYKKGIVDVSLDQKILDLLPDDHFRNYFHNSMYRLVLHGESHFEDAIRCAPEATFFSRLSTDEKQRTARDVLCFIYQVNPLHILSHLPGAGEDLDAWCREIRANAPAV